jgi:N-acetyl-gamma-glutamylphosphate reductase
MCAIDNLARGASAEAVQAMNVACGWPDVLGLPEVGLFP